MIKYWFYYRTDVTFVGRLCYYSPNIALDV